MDMMISTESKLLPHVTGLSTQDCQEILVDRIVKLAAAGWRTLARETQTLDVLIDLCIIFINQKTVHELTHVLGECNECAARCAEKLIPIKIDKLELDSLCQPM